MRRTSSAGWTASRERATDTFPSQRDLQRFLGVWIPVAILLVVTASAALNWRVWSQVERLSVSQPGVSFPEELKVESTSSGQLEIVSQDKGPPDIEEQVTCDSGRTFIVRTWCGCDDDGNPITETLEECAKRHNKRVETIKGVLCPGG